jgi:cytochrome c peroxidase
VRVVLAGIGAAVAAVACGSPSPSLVPDDGGSRATDAAGRSVVDIGADARDDPDPVVTADQWAALLALSPDSLSAAPPDPTNRFADDPAAAAFGQRLFFDVSFSGPLLDTDNDGSLGALGTPGQTGRVACASCHVPSSGFSDTRSFQRQISLGAGWGRRRAPSLLDVGQARMLMWDGRHDALYNQIFGPLETVVEMNASRLYMAEQIHREHKGEYEAIFGPMPALDDEARFPPLDAVLAGCQPKTPSDPAPLCDGPFRGRPGDQAEFDGMDGGDQLAVTTVVVNAGKAIGAFERRLACGAAPFDAWMHGDKAAVSRSAQRGASLFVGKGGCVACHAGPFMSDQRFHNVGLAPDTVQQGFIDTDDHGAASGLAGAMGDPLNSRGTFSDGNDGRLPAEIAPEMQGSFRTPTLRCVSARPTLMHTGQLASLEQAVAFFDRGGDGGGYPGKSEIHALGLTARERSDMVAFLQALAGKGADEVYLRAPAAP